MTRRQQECAVTAILLSVMWTLYGCASTIESYSSLQGCPVDKELLAAEDCESAGRYLVEQGCEEIGHEVSTCEESFSFKDCAQQRCSISTRETGLGCIVSYWNDKTGKPDARVGSWKFSWYGKHSGDPDQVTRCQVPSDNSHQSECVCRVVDESVNTEEIQPIALFLILFTIVPCVCTAAGRAFIINAMTPVRGNPPSFVVVHWSQVNPWFLKPLILGNANLLFSAWYFAWCIQVGTGAGIIMLALLATLTGFAEVLMDLYISSLPQPEKGLVGFAGVIGIVSDLFSISAVAFLDITAINEKDLLPVWLKVMDYLLSVVDLLVDAAGIGWAVFS